MPSKRPLENRGAAPARTHQATDTSPRKHNRDARELAKTLKGYLDSLGIELQHAHALEAVARLFDSPNFDALSARLTQPAPTSPATGGPLFLTRTATQSLLLKSADTGLPRCFEAHSGPIRVSLSQDNDISSEYFELTVSIGSDTDVDSDSGVCYAMPLAADDKLCTDFVSRVAMLVDDLVVASNGALGVRAMQLLGLTAIREVGLEDEMELQRVVQRLDREMADTFQLWHLIRTARHHFPREPHLTEVLQHELADHLVARARAGVHIVDQDEQDTAEREALESAERTALLGVEALFTAMQEVVGRHKLRATLFENINLPFIR